MKPRVISFFTALRPVLILGVINLGLILLLLNIASSRFAEPLGMALNLSSTNPQKAEVIIKLNSENVIYVNDKVITFNELRRFLARPNLKGGRLALQVDRRASAGRMMEVMELCRGLTQGQVYVVALD